MLKKENLRLIIEDTSTIPVPGVFNALSARVVEELGFQVGYITGAGVSNSILVLADVGLLTFKEMLDQVNYISDTTSIPFIVDGDTDYGNAVNVYRAVQQFEKAGATGIQLEDQVFPKKCGHFARKDVISKEEMIGKIQAAKDARKDDNFIIVARTDMIFVEVPNNLEEITFISKKLKGIPKILNIVEGGKTPIISLEEASKLGFKFVLYANAGLRASVKSAQNVYRHLKENGSTKGILEELITMEERNELTQQKATYGT